MKILALCSIKTQLWCFLKTKNSQKFLTWIWLNIFQLIMFKTWKKTQKRSKKDPQMKLPVHFTVLHIQKFSAISSNLVKIALFKGSFAPGNLEMAKYTWIYIKSGQKIPILTCNTFVDTFLPRALHTCIDLEFGPRNFIQYKRNVVCSCSDSNIWRWHWNIWSLKR